MYRKPFVRQRDTDIPSALRSLPPLEQSDASHSAKIVQSAMRAAGPFQPAEVLQLQRAAGNRAVAGLLTNVERSSAAAKERMTHCQHVLQNAPKKTTNHEVVVQRQGLRGKPTGKRAPPTDDVTLNHVMDGLSESIQHEGNRVCHRSVDSHFDCEPRQLATDACTSHNHFSKPIEATQRMAAGTKELNRSDLPDSLKFGLENLSGLDLSGVHVHYNSIKPAGIGAFAYAQGREIHIGPGHEELLPYESWHVVQQMQRRVRHMRTVHAVTINDDARLEREADVMGTKASRYPARRQSKGKTKFSNVASDPIVRPSGSVAPIQRFPMSVLGSSYTDWKKNTTRVESSTEGLTGGVYFLKSKPGKGLELVVVKPLIMESPEQLRFGGEFLRAFNIEMPISRVVDKNRDGKEFQQLLGLTEPEKRKHEDYDPNAWNAPKHWHAFQIMARAPGKSMSSLISSSKETGDVDKIVTLLKNDKLIQKLGELAVADAIIGNYDRLSKSATDTRTNLGNYMVTLEGQVMAIDTTATLEALTEEELAHQKTNTYKYQPFRAGEMLAQLLHHTDSIAEQFIGGVRAHLEKASQTQKQDLLGHFDRCFNRDDKATLVNSFERGVLSGLNKLDDIMRDKKLKSRLKKKATGNVSWSRLKSNYAYFKKYAHTLYDMYNYGFIPLESEVVKKAEEAFEARTVAGNRLRK